MIGWLCIQESLPIGVLKAFLLEIEGKLKRQAFLSQRSNTLDNQIADKKIVKGGLEQVEEAVKVAFEKAKRVDTKTLDIKGKEKFYNHVRGFMQVAFYAFVPQGRESGLTHLRYLQRTELLGDQGAAYTDKFKTAPRYGYQPVLADEYLKEMLRNFLQSWRPLLKYVMPIELLLDENGYLLPKWAAIMAVDNTDSIAAFTMNECGARMTSTKFRALWEMRAEYLYRNHQITLAQRKAVGGVNTHSGIKAPFALLSFKFIRVILRAGSITSMHYLLNDRVADVRGAKEVAVIAQGASQSSQMRGSYDDTQHDGRSQSSRISYDDTQYDGGMRSSHSRSSYDSAQSSHSRSSYDSAQSSILLKSTPLNTLSRTEQVASTPRSVETTLRSPADTGNNRRPAYMHQIKLASTKGTLGVHHPYYKDEEETGITGAVVKDKKVPFTDLEFGYLANWKRNDLANLVNYRLLPEVLGDNSTSRWQILNSSIKLNLNSFHFQMPTRHFE